MKLSWIRIKERLFLLRGATERKIERGIFVFLLIGFLLVLYQIGFPKEVFIRNWINHVLRQIPRVLMFFYFIHWVINVIFVDKKGIFHKEDSVELILFLLLLAFNFFKKYSGILSSDYFLFLLIISFFFLQFMAISSEIRASLMNPALLFSISFAVLILWGTAMLLIPNATVGRFRFVDAVFTATSAVCVTGLSVVDVSSKFTNLGTNIIIILVQIGGLGLMTFTNFFAVLFRGGTSLRNQLMVSKIVEHNEPGTLFSVLKKILFYTFFVEILGVILIYFTVHENFGAETGQAWYFSVFHSIAAFCNAGFSNVQDGLYNIQYRYNYDLLIIISILVIFGGVGFPVVNNLFNSTKYAVRGFFRKLLLNEEYKYQARVLTVHSKIVLSSTAILLVIGTVSFYFLEYNNTLTEHITQEGKLVQSFFASAVPRTAGFSAVNIASITQGTILISLLLMWIGGAPNSTAGGIKVTTFSLAVLSVVSLAKGKDRLEIFDREISLSSIQRSYVVIFLSFMILGVGMFLITIFDPGIPLQMIIFECFSAYATVGLSLNLTPMLSDNSKWVIIMLMFVGRVGLFTILFGFFSKDRNQNYQYPKESVQVL